MGGGGNAEPLDPHSVDGCIVNGSILKLLFCFTNLSSVALMASAGFDLNDKTVEDLTRAWPLLTSLEITSTDIQMKVGTTGAALLAFAQFRIPTKTYGPHRMADAVAQFLSGIFPRLVRLEDEITLAWPMKDLPPFGSEMTEEEQSWYDQWNEVNSLLSSFAAAQAKE
ncbi:hypothetical protein C8F01DRAFT_1293172 [Mycena amicta]|nr:hypothetical protein C8F01DRAFT_1293172 [Mycena amicta]